MMLLKKHLKNYARGLILPPVSIFVFMPFLMFGLIYYILLSITAIFNKNLSRLFFRHSLLISLGIDQLANASINGNEDQTISGRMGYAIKYLKVENSIINVICKILNKVFNQKDHCGSAIEYDRL